MARLALAAIMLLLAVPTVGRLVERHESDHGALTAICTVGGLKYVGLGHWGDSPPLQTPSPDPPHHPGMDCDYCPLLASAIVLAVLVGLFPLPLARKAGARGFASVRPRTFLHPCGLGSRGPPLAL
jgi:quinol-cytochrome oxidoreductase complex cytochrome b subunit